MSMAAWARRFCWRCWFWMSPPWTRSSFSAVVRSWPTCSVTRAAWRVRAGGGGGVGAAERVGPQPAPDASTDVVGEHPDAADRVGQVDLAQVRDLVGDGFQPGEGDEGPQHVVGAFEDGEHAAVA